jgi:3'-5' exoribonuclease
MFTKTVYIRELQEGQQVEDVFVLVEARQAQSRNGPFWDLTLQDRTGQVGGKIWYPQSSEYSDLRPEQLVLVKAAVRSFRDQKQLVVQQLRVLDAQEHGLDWSSFMPCSATPPEDILQELENLCRSELSYPPWKRVIRQVLRDSRIRERMLAAPAAKTIHHAYRGGLLEHTLAVARTCLSLCDNYPHLDREILLVAAVLHDLGKAWELEGGLSRDYTDEGRLLGHIVLGLQVLEPFLSQARDLDEGLVLHLKHLILSHHGEYEFGSPKRPKTPEAMVLHYADNLDAKVNTVQQALDAAQESGANWSAYQHSLERQLYRAAHTASFQDSSRDREAGKTRQCLLPLKE